MSGNNKSDQFLVNPLAQDLDHILKHTRDPLEDFRNSNVFITGGTGFFGTWLLETLAWANIHVDLNVSALVLTRNPKSFAMKAPHLYGHDRFTFKQGDVRNFDFPDGKFTHIFHFATEASDKLNKEAPLEMLNVIVEGTRHTLDFAVSAGVKKILMASSGAVYGKQPPEISHITEGFSGAPAISLPESAYGEGKRVAELLAGIYSDRFGLEIKIARCFAFVGPYLPLDQHFAIGNFINDIIKNEDIVIKGDGTPIRSYLYAADLIIWLLTIFINGQTNYPYNVGSQEEISIGQLAQEIVSLLNPCKKIEVKGIKGNRILPERYVPSTDRARKELGLLQTISRAEAIKRTYIFNIEPNT